MLVTRSYAILLEGADRLSLKVLLSRFIITDKYFSLDTLNTAINNCSYSSTDELDKPRMVEKGDILPSGSLSQSAASMRVLMYGLPFLIGEFVPEGNEHWLNFIKLLQINILCFSPYASYRTVCSLRALIAAHNKNFVALNPGVSFIPKLHYVTHFPEQLRMFGPLRQHSCMRFEAKHGSVKIKKWSNFKSIEKSVAEYHQRWMCLQQVDANGNRTHNYMYKGDEVKYSASMKLKALLFSAELLACEPSVGLSEDSSIMISPEIKVNGITGTYNKGSVLVWKWPSVSEPELMEVESIVVYEENKYLVCKKLEIVEFSTHFNSFTVKDADAHQPAVLKVNNLYSAWPQIVHKLGSCKYVMMHCDDDVWTV